MKLTDHNVKFGLVDGQIVMMMDKVEMDNSELFQIGNLTAKVITDYFHLIGHENSWVYPEGPELTKDGKKMWWMFNFKNLVSPDDDWYTSHCEISEFDYNAIANTLIDLDFDLNNNKISVIKENN